MTSVLSTIHQGLMRADTKASILLGISTALLAAVLTSLATAVEKKFFVRGTVPFVLAVIGAACLLAAVLLLLVAAMPRRLRKPGPAGWMQYARMTATKDVVAAVVRTHTDIDAQAQQIRLLSRIALEKWRQLVVATIIVMTGLVIFFISVTMRLMEL